MVATTDRTTASALATLDQASERRVPWSEVAHALLTLEGSGHVDPSGRPWVQIGADKSKFATDNLRRMTKVARWLEGIVAETKVNDIEVLRTLPLSHVDVLMRIGAVDRGEAIRIFDSIDDEGRLPATFRSLLQIHDRLRESRKAPSPAIAASASKRLFENSCFETLSSADVLRLDRNARLVRSNKDYPYANPDFLIIRRVGSAIAAVEGVDCHALRGESQRDLVVKRALQAALESSFFDRFWIALPSDHAEAFERERLLLGMTNVALIVVDDQGSKIVGTPEWPPAEPAPDRRPVWRKAAAL